MKGILRWESPAPVMVLIIAMVLAGWWFHLGADAGAFMDGELP